MCSLDELDLVSLQMTDETPANVAKVLERGRFVGELLRIILTED